MKKHNPLFLDSTQPVGDKIITNVELLDATLAQGETFYIEVTDSFGFQQKFALKMIATKKSVRYSAELWLNQNEEIQYRFVLVSSGVEIQSSIGKSNVAGAAISEKWIPGAAVKATVTVKGKNKESKRTKFTEIKKVGSGKGQAPLVADQDYQQMKFLLGELE